MKKRTKMAITSGLVLVTFPIYAKAFEMIESSLLSNILNITATPDISNNLIKLDWSGDTYNKTFKVYQKKPGSSDFQSISATNFNKSNQVKVLNIYPAGGAVESYTTWDGENISLMKSASLKRWMEEPNSENPKGYGKGVIEVTPVLLSEFNKNPVAYMRNSDGSWKYDVVMVGSYDCNGTCTVDGDLTSASASVVRDFINDGRGALLGHDTAYYSSVHGNLNSLMDLFNMKIGHGIHTSTVPTQVQGTVITVKKKGLLTNYPWEVGDIGTNLTIPYTHTTGQLTNGDVWMDFNDLASPTYDGTYKGNFYLTTWNNTGYILTGHSNAQATPDEQKLLANTLFYLNQLSTETSLNDNSGQDVNAPNKINTITHTLSNGVINYSLTKPTDVGSNYSYYVIGEGKDGSLTQSNTVSTSITSDVKGYSYVVDNNPSTIPDNIVDTTSNNISVNITNNNMYLHVKAIDNAGNGSETTNYQVSDTTAPTMNITGNPTSWINQNATLSVTGSDVGTGVKEIVLPDGTIVYSSSVNYTVTANGNYTFRIRDNMGNETSQTISVTKIDKAINTLSGVNQNMNIVNATTSTRKMTFTFNPITDSASGLKGYSYVIDNNATTVPDDVIDTTSTTITKDITDSGVYYLHIKAIDNAGNISNVIHKKVDIPTLSATVNATEDMIRLDWALDDINSNTFKVYQKKPGSNTFQTIGTTNFENVKQVKVLNIYPSVSGAETFTTWDGETVTLPPSARLKRWMEEPNSDNPKGYGKGIIEVTPVTQSQFNANPSTYLSKDSNGNYNYDVVVIGFWDSNGSADLTSNSKPVVENFILNGGGVLFGHDTLNSGKVLYQLSDYVNTTGASNVYGNGSDTSGFGGYSSITIRKKGLLTNYPWEIGDIGTNLTIPQSHTWQMAKGDIWLDFNNTYPARGSLIENSLGTNNHYLTTNNNTALIQTGHSNGSATPDEQKILANTLFYLNQLSTDNFLDDNSGQDVNAPNIPVIYEHNFISKGNVEVEFNGVTDNGSEYSYYVESQTKDNSNLTLSNTVTKTITSGLKGYSYVVDSSSTTIPDNEIECTSPQSIMVQINNGNDKYVHIKAVDNVGNASETYHYKITETTKPIMSVTGNPTEWTNKDIQIKIEADDLDSGIQYIELPNGNRVTGRSAIYTINQNGNYVFKAVDFMGNVTIQTVNVTKIDKSSPVITANKTINSNKSDGYIDINVTDTISGFDYLLAPDGTKIKSPNYRLSINQNGLYLFTAYDITGNMSVLSVNVNELTNANIVPSEIARIEYKLSGATVKDWTTYTGAFYVTNEGITTITARAYDKAGNISSEKSTIVKLDKTKPSNNSILIELRTN